MGNCNNKLPSFKLNVSDETAKRLRSFISDLEKCDPSEITHSTFDMSSNEPHIMVHCPICMHEWQKKVEEKEFVSECDCKLTYSMKKEPDGMVNVEFSVPNSMLKF